MSETFNAADILEKTLIATKRLNVYRQAQDGAQVAGWVEAGQPLGVVFAWLSPNPELGRSKLWWSLYPVNNMYYYVPHNEGDFSVSALKSQGVISTDQKTKDAAEKQLLDSMSLPEQLLHKYGWYLAIPVALFAAPGIIGAFRK